LKKIFNEVLMLPDFKKGFKKLEKNYPYPKAGFRSICKYPT